MKKNTQFFILLLSIFACNDDAKFKVINRISNSKLEKISFGNYKVSNSIITNETSNTEEITDKSGSFPKNECITFYMSANGNKVLLRTVNKYSLSADEDKTFVIDDSTDVVIP